MNRAPVLGFCIALLFVAFSVLYYKFWIEKKDQFLLDNPTEKIIEVLLNGEKYILAPGQSFGIQVLKGKNSLSSKYKDSSDIVIDTFFTLEYIPNRGLINSTKSEYYTFRQYYGGVFKNLDSLYKISHISIDEKVYFGDIKKHDEIFINDFYFNVNEEFYKMKFKGDSLDSRVKLFRKNQFIEYYQTNFQ